MSSELIWWLLIFCLQSAVLGRTLYVLICLTDLEQDYLNPFELSARINKWVTAEVVGQAVLTLFLFLSGHYALALLHVVFDMYLGHLLVEKRLTVDATDAFKQLPAQKRQRTIHITFCTLSFIVVLYKLVATAVHTLLTPEGKEITKKLLQEAAASVHGY